MRTVKEKTALAIVVVALLFVALSTLVWRDIIGKAAGSGTGANEPLAAGGGTAIKKEQVRPCEKNLDCVDFNPCTTEECKEKKCVYTNLTGENIKNCASCNDGQCDYRPRNGCKYDKDCLMRNTECQYNPPPSNTNTVCNQQTGYCHYKNLPNGTMCAGGLGQYTGQCWNGVCVNGYGIQFCTSPSNCTNLPGNNYRCVDVGCENNKCQITATYIGQQRGCPLGQVCIEYMGGTIGCGTPMTGSGNT